MAQQTEELEAFMFGNAWDEDSGVCVARPLFSIIDDHAYCTCETTGQILSGDMMVSDQRVLDHWVSMVPEYKDLKWTPDARF